MSEYTPTTEEVRRLYVRHCSLRGRTKYPPLEELEAEFDRWLAALIREAKAEALNEAAEHVAEQSVRYADTASRLHDEGEWVDSSRYSNYAAGVSMALTTLRARAAEYRKAVES